MKKTDWAIRGAKNDMLASLGAIQRRYSHLDDIRFSLEKDLATVEAAIQQYYRELKMPMYRFFAGDTLEMVVGEAHEAFIKSLKDHIRAGRLSVNAGVSDRLLDSLRRQIVQNIDGMVLEADRNMRARARDFSKAAAESANNAAIAQIQSTQLKIESITSRTTGAEDLQKAWIKLQEQYGRTDTVKYRDGKNYPLNTYIDGRAKTTATDIHVTSTQYDASAAGVFTGMITTHGATDSCKDWEGKLVCFTPEGREMMSQKFPEAKRLKTVDEIRRDKSTHMWKFNCTHGITSYPIQFLDDNDARAIIAEAVAA